MFKRKQSVADSAVPLEAEAKKQQVRDRVLRSLRVFLLLETLWAAAFGVHLALVTPYLAKLGIDEQRMPDIVMIIASVMVIQAALEVPLGWIADRFGNIPIIRAGYLALLFSFLSLSLLDRFPDQVRILLFTAEFLMGLAMALRSGALESWLLHERELPEGQAPEIDRIYARRVICRFCAQAITGSTSLVVFGSLREGGTLFQLAAIPIFAALIVSVLLVDAPPKWMEDRQRSSDEPHEGEANKAWIWPGNEESRSDEPNSPTTLAACFASFKYAAAYAWSRRRLTTAIAAYTVFFGSGYLTGYLYVALFVNFFPDGDKWQYWLAALGFLLVSGSRMVSGKLADYLQSVGYTRSRRLSFGFWLNPIGLILAGGIVALTPTHNAPFHWIFLTVVAITMVARLGEELIDTTTDAFFADNIIFPGVRATTYSIMSVANGLYIAPLGFALSQHPSLKTVTHSRDVALGIGWLWILVGIGTFLVGGWLVRQVHSLECAGALVTVLDRQSSADQDFGSGGSSVDSKKVWFQSVLSELGLNLAEVLVLQEDKSAVFVFDSPERAFLFGWGIVRDSGWVGLPQPRVGVTGCQIDRNSKAIWVAAWQSDDEPTQPRKVIQAPVIARGQVELGLRFASEVAEGEVGVEGVLAADLPKEYYNSSSLVTLRETPDLLSWRPSSVND